MFLRGKDKIMANPERNEVDFSFGDNSYTFKFSNAGRRELESQLDMEMPAINEKLAAGQIGPRILSALVFGATRKYHGRQFPNMTAVDNLLDSIEDADEDADGAPNATELFLSVASAFLGVDKKTLSERMGKAEEAPKAPETKTPKKQNHKVQPLSEAGSAS